MSWTDERIARLKALAAEGLSGGQIATELGDVTRNAVMGKLMRLRIPLLGHSSAPAVTAVAQDLRKTRVKARDIERRASSKEAEAEKTDSAEVRAGKRAIARSETISAGAPECRRVPMIELRMWDCRWPLGDPQHADFAFCGNATDLATYCPYHSALAYAPRLARVPARQAG